MSATSHRGSFRCPAFPEHGDLISPTSQAGKWYCPHQAHDGRPKTHPLGGAPATRAFYKQHELETINKERLTAAASPSIEPSPLSSSPTTLAETDSALLAPAEIDPIMVAISA